MCAEKGQKSCQPNPYIIIIKNQPTQTIPKMVFPKAYFKTEF
jgi:hypothetical protein